MFISILSCDEHEAEKICEEWLQEPAYYINCTAKYEILPVPLEGQQRTWLSAECKPAKEVRTRAIAIMSSCLLICLLLILLMPSFVVWAGKLTATSTPSVKLLVSVGYFLPFLITVMSPLYTLGHLYQFCRREESYLTALFILHGVESNVLNPGDHWTWFRDDEYIIMFGFVGTAVIRLLTAFNIDVWNIFQLANPVLPMILVLFVIFVIRTIVYMPLKNVSHLPLYWKIKVTALADISDIFYFLVFFYILLIIVGHITLFLLILPDGMVQNSSISEIFTILMTLFSDSWILKGIIHSGGLDGFSKFLGGWSDSRFKGMLYVEWAVGVIVFLGYFRLICSIFKPKEWQILEWQFGELPEEIVFKGSHPIVHGALLLEWLLEWIVRVAGVTIGLGCILVIFLPSEWILGQWSIPFLWYEASFRIILGIVAGSIVANALLLLATAPMLLWLLLWFISLLHDCRQFLSCIISQHRERDDKVQTIMSDLCKILRIRQPIIRLVQGSTGGAITSFFLPVPMFSVIHLPTGLVEKLTQTQNQNQLRLVLAHELGHVTQHAWKVWWLQLLSRLSLTGQSYLTLFLDYWSMEMEADAFAVQLTGDGRGLIALLEQQKGITGDFLAGQRAQEGHQSSIQKVKNLCNRLIQHAWIAQLVKTYNIHFGDPFWGVLHPPEEERIKNLYNIIFERENLGSLDRFTEQAKQVVEYAKDWVKYLQDQDIETYHLLLGLLQIDFGIEIMSTLDEYLEKASQESAPIPSGGEDSPLTTIDFLHLAKRVIVQAAHEADIRNQPSIGPEHLLLGLLQEQNTVVFLEGIEIDLEKVRQAILEKLDSQDKEIR